ncbi:hypothetical protein FIBSPDRAFT_735234 [Athelia psychrophila]|uniref:Uncharacterized protein n=1 Tax=Athelia psychrophila TaxID=1759441 RepID=A0A166NDL3_9AGAM|nr:hypothetical protein FIBSPDRAFT_735234 [Fibularhizoctonia sp. CBS 109695]
MHARWRDGVLAHHIVDVRHRPGALNGAADGLSRQFTAAEKNDKDGHLASVNPDWEASSGLTHNIFAALEEEHQHQASTTLREPFANEPIFLQVIDVLWDLDRGKTRRARHQSLGYWINDSKLWRLGDGKSTRAGPRRECVSQKEAVELARTEHLAKGHEHRDLIKKQLMDFYCSPRLDKSIMTALLDCG